jgi:hypothetical protein
MLRYYLAMKGYIYSKRFSVKKDEKYFSDKIIELSPEKAIENKKNKMRENYEKDEPLEGIFRKEHQTGVSFWKVKLNHLQVSFFRSYSNG